MQVSLASSGYPRDLIRLRFEDQDGKEHVLVFTDEHAGRLVQILRSGLDRLTYGLPPEVPEVLLRAQEKPSRRLDEASGILSGLVDPPLTYEGALIAEDDESNHHIHVVKFAVHPGHDTTMTEVTVSRFPKEELVAFARAVIRELS